jgi:uncharacterized protein YbjT (DUF2867 family)
MADSKIVVTGASGFIGSDVVARLLKEVPAERLVLLGRSVPKEDSLFSLRMGEHGLSDRARGLRWVKTIPSRSPPRSSRSRPNAQARSSCISPPSSTARARPLSRSA